MIDKGFESPVSSHGEALSVLAAQGVIWRDIAASGSRLLRRRISRNAAQVAAEYDRGVWNRILTDKPWLRCETLHDYVVSNDAAKRVATVEGRLVRMTTSEYYEYRLSALLALMERYAAGDDRLCELGCGAGLNVFSLALSKKWKSLDGYDVSQHAVQAAREAAAHFCLNHLSFGLMDLTARDNDGSMLEGRTVFTHYCLEQLKYSTSLVIEKLIRMRVKRVIHIEPAVELLHLWRPADLSTYLYIASQDYQDNLLRTLKKFEARGALRIVEKKRLYYAPTAKHDAAVVCWEPVDAAIRADR